MSQFECSMKDLDGRNVKDKTVVKNKNENKNENVNENENVNVNKNVNDQESVVPKTEMTYINISLLDKIKEEKNIKTILLIIIAYIITSSSQFNDILGNSLPYLMENGTTNLLGKIVISILIGLVVVLFTSFFQDQ